MKDYTVDIFGGNDAPVMECAFKPLQVELPDIMTLMESFDPEIADLYNTMNLLQESLNPIAPKIHNPEELNAIMHKVMSIRNPEKYVNLIMKTVFMTIKVYMAYSAYKAGTAAYGASDGFMNGVINMLEKFGLGALGWMLLNKGAPVIEWFIVKFMNSFSQNKLVSTDEKIYTLKNNIRGIDNAIALAISKRDNVFATALGNAKRQLESEIEKAEDSRVFISRKFI